MHLSKPYHLFDCFGIELEYAIISRESGMTLPIADHILRNERGKVVNAKKIGPCEVSNELALHVIELKTPEPVASLEGWETRFQETLYALDEKLKPLGAMLMPTGMHPFMDPSIEAKLWPHGDQAIYHLYDKIFNCRRHGWANLQSCHINMPFQGDGEFKKLHDAIILILPLLPSLSASSPFYDGVRSGFMDSRLRHYAENQKQFPLITGLVIPEAVASKKEYEDRILHPMYAQVAEIDPEGLLREEWLNSRAAITHFGRGSIEIRALDAQECPLADLALSSFITGLLKWMTEAHSDQLGKWVADRTTKQRKLQWDSVVHKGMNARFELEELNEMFPLKFEKINTVADFWENLWECEVLRPTYAPYREVIKTLIFRGNLSSRMQLSIPERAQMDEFRDLLSKLNRCLMHNELFFPETING